MDEAEGPKTAVADGAGDRTTDGADDRSGGQDGDAVATPGRSEPTGPESGAPGADGEEGEGNVAGVLAPDLPVEPGVVEPVNALFVALGAYAGVLAIGTFVGSAGAFTLVDYATITVVYAALAGLAYAALTRSNPDT
jgi:hypothetical protein